MQVTEFADQLTEKPIPPPIAQPIDSTPEIPWIDEILLRDVCVEPANFKQENTIYKKDESGVYTICEVQPQFESGVEGLMRFMKKNIHYPEGEKYDEVEIVLRFVVSKNGKCRNPVILNSQKEFVKFEEEVLRIFSFMPDWQPGLQNGEAVDAYYTIPITFKP
ncbi:MAG: hypothetical protein GC181_10505 [Bacteroidetes bacterium]|nr:hypothetical protein [Bacteroidota bacterium]